MRVCLSIFPQFCLLLKVPLSKLSIRIVVSISLEKEKRNRTNLKGQLVPTGRTPVLGGISHVYPRLLEYIPHFSNEAFKSRSSSGDASENPHVHSRNIESLAYATPSDGESLGKVVRTSIARNFKKLHARSFDSTNSGHSAKSRNLTDCQSPVPPARVSSPQGALVCGRGSRTGVSSPILL